MTRAVVVGYASVDTCVGVDRFEGVGRTSLISRAARQPEAGGIARLFAGLKAFKCAAISWVGKDAGSQMWVDTLNRMGVDTTGVTVELHGGGAAANVASWMGRAGHHPHFYCAIGDDIIGHALVADLQHVGVDVHATHTAGPTGAVVALVHPDGERTMFPSSEANGGLSMSGLDGVVHPGDHVHLSGYVLLRENSRAKALQSWSTTSAVTGTVRGKTNAQHSRSSMRSALRAEKRPPAPTASRSGRALGASSSARWITSVESMPW